MTSLTVHAGAGPRRLCPVAVDFTSPMPARGKLVHVPTNQPIRCQIEPLKQGWRLHWVVRQLPAGESATYHFTGKEAGRQPAPRLRWESLGRNLCVLKRREQPWLRLDGQARMPYAQLVDGSGFHRLCLTTQLRSRRHLRTRVDQLGTFVEGPVWSSLHYRGDWLDEAEHRILVEETTWRGYQPSRDVRVLDVTVMLHANFGPWAFADETAPGLLQAELDSSSASLFLDQHGPTTAQSSLPSYWWGTVGRGVSGLFVHPDNPGHVPSWHLNEGGTLVHRPLSENRKLGVLGASPPLRLALGEALTWRYRHWSHRDPQARGWLREAFLDFARPPEVVAMAQD